MYRSTISMEDARTLYALDRSDPHKGILNKENFYFDNGISIWLSVKEFVQGVSTYSALARGGFRDDFTLHVSGKNSAVLRPLSLYPCNEEERPTSAIRVKTTTRAFIEACQGGPVILTYRGKPFGVLTSCGPEPEQG